MSPTFTKKEVYKLNVFPNQNFSKMARTPQSRRTMEKCILSMEQNNPPTLAEQVPRGRVKINELINTNTRLQKQSSITAMTMVPASYPPHLCLPMMTKWPIQTSLPAGVPKRRFKRRPRKEWWYSRRINLQLFFSNNNLKENADFTESERGREMYDEIIYSGLGERQIGNTEKIKWNKEGIWKITVEK